MLNTRISTNCTSFASMVKARWPKLNEADLALVANDMEALIDVLQDRYGFSADDADQQVHEFEVSNKIPDFESQTCRRYYHA